MNIHDNQILGEIGAINMKIQDISHPAILKRGILDSQGFPTLWSFDSANYEGPLIELKEDGRLFIAGIELDDGLEARRRCMAGTPLPNIGGNSAVGDGIPWMVSQEVPDERPLDSVIAAVQDLSNDDRQALYKFMHNSLGLRIY